MASVKTSSSPPAGGVPKSLLPINTVDPSLSTTLTTYRRRPNEWYTNGYAATFSGSAGRKAFQTVSTATSATHQPIETNQTSASGQTVSYNGLRIGLIVTFSVVIGCLCALGIVWYAKRAKYRQQRAIIEDKQPGKGSKFVNKSVDEL
jgi:hypothetical protein